VSSSVSSTEWAAAATASFIEVAATTWANSTEGASGGGHGVTP
jgi:hypothetical protein